MSFVVSYLRASYTENVIYPNFETSNSNYPYLHKVTAEHNWIHSYLWKIYKSLNQTRTQKHSMNKKNHSFKNEIRNVSNILIDNLKQQIKIRERALIKF